MVKLGVGAGIAGIACMLVACGESSPSSSGGAGHGGTAGMASSGRASMTGGSGMNAAAGGSSGAGTSGGRAGTSSGAAGTSSGAAGTSSGAAGTSSGAAGTSSGAAGTSSGGNWSAACNGVTMNGHCVGNVYEWCDYWTRGVRQLDCGARGETCAADASLFGEEDQNGCVGGPCTPGEGSCDGTLATRCQDGHERTWDCTKDRGSDSTCTMAGTAAKCTYSHCDPPNDLSCDANVLVICTETNEAYLEDCTRCDAAGTCEASGNGAGCTIPSFGCSQGM